MLMQSGDNYLTNYVSGVEHYSRCSRRLSWFLDEDDLCYFPLSRTAFNNWVRYFIPIIGSSFRILLVV
jgi:hypothetical protein